MTSQKPIIDFSTCPDPVEARAFLRAELAHLLLHFRETLDTATFSPRLSDTTRQEVLARLLDSTLLLTILYLDITA